MAIPQSLLAQLNQIEKDATFSGSLPKVRSSTGKLYFVKLGSPSEKEQFLGEAASLKAIDEGASGLAPKVYVSGATEDGKPYFISEYKEIGSLSSAAAVTLGKRLAEMHGLSSKGKGFGFEVATYCGATRMENGWFDTWAECYTIKIEELLGYLRKKGGSSYAHLIRKGERVRDEVIPKLLGPLKIEPVILHGDLWSGNAGTESSTGEPVIYDPSSYYGHNEADLSMARIFGGFPQSFYTEYHKHIPKTDPQDQYDLRGDLYELYHYLNHTVLFGGGYASSAMAKMDRLLDAKL
ncbi:hypothetical protein PQX77_000616 [Marasmius sp. AFHP31]|nr:hypothetical protein PQX77_000616 [Marasmius sp. AFHP31]